MKTTVVHCKRAPYDHYIGRGSPLGNPFIVGRDGSREECIAKFKCLAESDPDIIHHIQAVQGTVLGCHCKPKACHGDVIAEIADRNRGGLLEIARDV